MNGIASPLSLPLATPERLRRDSGSSILLLCDHASNFIPQVHQSLGLEPENLDDHFVWDVGSAAVTRRLSELLDCPAILATTSRLLIDCNRDPDDPDSIVDQGEGTPVPGNASVSEAERAARISAYYDPYHHAITEACETSAAPMAAIFAIHSFVPVYNGSARPWHIGLIHDRDPRLAASIASDLRTDAGLNIGNNEPYRPSDRVYHTLSRHADTRGLPSLMIELRNDLIATEVLAIEWAERLAPVLLKAVMELGPSGVGHELVGEV